MSWTNLPTDAQADSNFENYMEKLAEPLPPPPKPMEETKLVDIAEAVEAPKPYVAREGEEKPFEKRKKEGVKDFAPPVDVYEPGFRSDMYAAMVKYFKQQRAIRDRNEMIRKKIGLRG